jgi:hypothetical protein
MNDPRSVKRARLLAYYLPQFHPIPENDLWWGQGFTEWTNVARAKPLFPGHYQPRIPADLGFYDLRVPETRAAQAEMAEAYGIEGFCYYHYWFAGREILERPLKEVLRSGEPKFPFCVCWANENWTGIWSGHDSKIFLKQNYPPGESDDRVHFRVLLDAFSDDRYITLDGKPVFMIYQPDHLPDPRKWTDTWRELAHRAGLKGLYLIAYANHPWPFKEMGFDASTPKILGRMCMYDPRWLHRLKVAVRFTMGYAPRVFSYRRIVHSRVSIFPEAEGPDVFPCVLPNWDNTPRRGKRGYVFHGSTPALFSVLLHRTIEQVLSKPPDYRCIFVKSWNEWAEGNYLEPDLKFGRGYLETIRSQILTAAAS